MPSLRIAAAVARAPHQPLSIETLELAEPRADEILVRLVATGVCHTDIAMRDQAFPVPQPIVLGHEGAGIVERVGTHVTKVVPGDHVIMSYNSCGACRSCLANATSYCYDFFGRNFAGARADQSTPLSRDGMPIHGNFFGQSSFASHAICHPCNTLKVPTDLPLDRLGPLACGVQTGAGAVLNGLRVKPGSSFAAFGVGSVGLSAILAARVAGAGTVIAVDKLDARLELAREFGATHTSTRRRPPCPPPTSWISPAVARTSRSTPRACPTVIRQAVECLAARGTCAILGASAVGTELTLDAIHLMTGGRSIRGTVEGDSRPDVFIPMLIDLYRQGRFPFDRMLKFYPFEQINQAVADSEHRPGDQAGPEVR